MNKLVRTTKSSNIYEAPRLLELELAKMMNLMKRFSTIEFEIDDFVDGEDF